MAKHETVEQIREDNRLVGIRASDQAAEIERLKRQIGAGVKAEAKLAALEAELDAVKAARSELVSEVDRLKSQLKSANELLVQAEQKRAEAEELMKSFAYQVAND